MIIIARKYEFVCIGSIQPSDDSIDAPCSAVKYQMKLYSKNLKDGDVIITNSPRAGGSYVPRNSSLSLSAIDLPFFASHLPDITIITPVFDKNSGDIIFFTASRGHHADIGGILPGSMASLHFPLNQPHMTDAKSFSRLHLSTYSKRAQRSWATRSSTVEFSNATHSGSS